MHHGLIALNSHEGRTSAALFERLFPADEHGPGATEIGVLTYVDSALTGAYSDCIETYRLGLAALDRASQLIAGARFADLSERQQDEIIARLQRGVLPSFEMPEPSLFFHLLLAHCQEGLFADPIYGGNRDKSGWRFLGHPGICLENSAEEQLSEEPVTKGGTITSLADLGWTIGNRPVGDSAIPGFDPTRGAAPLTQKVDVILVGVGAVGGLIAPMLAKAGLKVVGFEAGPYRTPADFLPDELGSTYYCRQTLGSKFLSEEIRWRTGEDQETRNPTYSLGRMMNGVGGSVVHYGGWLRRYHPHHFQFRGHVVERWGERALPEGCTLADWTVTYDELEPYYTRVEWEAGIAGDESNPFITRSKPLPLPPMREYRLGRLFTEGAQSLGLHPHPVPVGQNTEPYNGYPVTGYSSWNNGFGSWTGDKWHPGLTSVPQALATGNFDLRTHCRVLRVLTNEDGRATGVEYVDATGNVQVQHADAVILAAYTWENIRLLFLSRDDRHPSGLGNNCGQLGKHLMIKQFPHVDGYFPNIVFNRHAGPASQAIVLDDYVAREFNSWGQGGFIGGATLGAENQFLPIQIARETLPPDVPCWGSGYKAHLKKWQHLGVVRYQPDTLPYECNYADLDPRAKDRSGFGLPVVRATYTMMPNEVRQADYFADRATDVLVAMGAERTWAGPRFTGVASSHDLGGTRMSDNPAGGVLDRSLRVHDTPGLYVFSGSAFPSCPGVNPTLTIWALCELAAERLIERLRDGKEL
jgi:gluconate 2-dehydrogenase alpha chain